jgi:hypothetical protein
VYLQHNNRKNLIKGENKSTVIAESLEGREEEEWKEAG